LILVIDNFDSFTWNIVQYLQKLGQEVVVKRNNEITLEEMARLEPRQLIISPGPGNPDSAGVSMAAIRHFAGKIPVLGVCLGHQSIGQVFGGKIVRAKKLYHGKTSDISHDGKGIFSALPSPFKAARYHSLVIEQASCPPELEITAWSEDGEIMGVRHKTLDVEGIQFHPESIATEHGYAMLENFLNRGAPLADPKIRLAIRQVWKGQELTEPEAEAAMEEIVGGQATQAQIAGFLTALAIKGETAPEIAAFVRVMRRHVVAVAKPAGRLVVDVVGTGGDGSHTFNISTTSAFVVAGAGLTVAKHGNRSITSKCGSADVLEALGVPIDLPPEAAARCLSDAGMVFLFAQKHHPGMKHAGPVRKELGMRTVFNVLGPLTNPTGAEVKVIGVFDPRLTAIFAEVLHRLGHRRGMVVHGSDGLDEVTLTGPTQISELKDGWIKSWTLHPETLGFDRCDPQALKGGDAKANAATTLEILEGKKGPMRDIVLLNSAAVIYTADKAADLPEALRMAAQSIDSGAARGKLAALAAFRA
jgi:anthranilate synthase/phosphoribosyltransferase